MDSTASASALDLASLRGTLLGEVLVGGDPGYDAARAVWNAMIDRRPALIARCKGTADVLDAVRFAREHGLPVSIRGGGHNVAGHAVGEGGLMVDLSAMRAVRVDPRTAARLGRGRRDLARGRSRDPGLRARSAGRPRLGHGRRRPDPERRDRLAARRHGLTIDNLVAADVVTAGGRLRPRQRDGAPRPLVGAQGRGREFRRRHRVRVRPPPGRAHADVLRAALPAEAGSAPIRFWRDFLADKNDAVGSLVEFSTIPSDPAYPRPLWGQRVYTIAAV